MFIISYRREDAAPITGRIYDRLQKQFGSDQVFMDIDNIPPGVDFRSHISESLERCNALLAVIGSHWAGPVRAGRRRIDDTADFVRLEVGHALKRGIPVIPILIDDATMPQPDELPSDLEGLPFRNALRVDSGIDFHHHVDRLCAALQRFKERPVSPLPKTPESEPVVESVATPKRQEVKDSPSADDAPYTSILSLARQFFLIRRKRTPRQRKLRWVFYFFFLAFLSAISTAIGLLVGRDNDWPAAFCIGVALLIGTLVFRRLAK
jgi:hypothetical protein